MRNIFLFYAIEMLLIFACCFPLFHHDELLNPPGGSQIDLVYVHSGIRTCTCLLGCFFRKVWYSGQWVFIRDEGAQIQELGVFGANYCTKYPIWAKLGAFLSKKVY